MAAILLALAPSWALIQSLHRFPQTKKKRRAEKKRLRKLRQAKFREAQRLALPRSRMLVHLYTSLSFSWNIPLLMIHVVIVQIAPNRLDTVPSHASTVSHVPEPSTPRDVINTGGTNEPQATSGVRQRLSSLLQGLGDMNSSMRGHRRDGSDATLQAAEHSGNGGDSANAHLPHDTPPV